MTTTRPTVGILLPTRGILLKGDRPPDAQLVAHQARRAEEAGLDSVWVGDSLTSKPRLDPLATLAAVAASTERVRIGTSVLLGALYHPVHLARTAATVDLLSRGRLTMGMGIGGAFTEDQKREWTHAGVSRTTRATRLEEVVEVVKLLWGEDLVTFHGRHFTLENVQLEPRPFHPDGIPIWLTCHHRTGSDAQVDRVLRLADGFIAITDQPDEYPRTVARLQERGEALEREVTGMDRAFYMTVNLNGNAAEARNEADAFIRAYYGVNVWNDTWGPFGPPETVAARMREYLAAGVQHLIVRFASFDQPGQMETFVREVVPNVR